MVELLIKKFNLCNMGCGCKKQKTPEPIKTPNTVTTTENTKQGQLPTLTKQQQELLEKLKRLAKK